MNWTLNKKSHTLIVLIETRSLTAGSERRGGAEVSYSATSFFLKRRMTRSIHIRTLRLENGSVRKASISEHIIRLDVFRGICVAHYCKRQRIILQSCNEFVWARVDSHSVNVVD